MTLKGNPMDKIIAAGQHRLAGEACQLKVLKTLSFPLLAATILAPKVK